MDIKCELMHITKKSALSQLSQKYSLLINKLLQEGGYIWGTGRLGQFAHEQCEKGNIKIKGYIDNNQSKWNADNHIFSCSVLKADDIIIIASLYYPDIIEQLENMGIKSYIFYEELAFLVGELDTYSPTFENLFGELEINRERYREVYDLLSDEISREVYEDIISYRFTMDIKYTKRAFERSLKEGVQDFDKVIVDKLDKEYTFYDVGGYDGESTIQYITHAGDYKKIYFFEPDGLIMEGAKKRLKNKNDIQFVQAGVGEHKGLMNYDALGDGAGTVSEKGKETVEIVALDDLVDDHKSYIKMDIEGYEMLALKGAERCIKLYKPMLSISVYHLPGDIHRIIHQVLSWNPKYKVYMRHYTNTYTDTRVYFIDEGAAQ